MKSLFLCFGFSALSLTASHAASAFWSFQSVAGGGTYNGPGNNAPSGGYTTTSSSGFLTTPTFTAVAGTGGGVVSGTGGGLSYVDLSTNTNWLGNGTDTPAQGWNVQWGSNATQNLTGAGFILGLNTTGLSDLKVRFDLRSASSQNGTIEGQTGAVTSFSAINYRINGGAWASVGATSSTWNLSGGWQAGAGTVDLSAFDFLENVENLELEFVFNGGAKIPMTTGGSIGANPVHNIRIDNLLVSAVPEPASAVMFLGGGLFALRRRRATTRTMF